MRPNRPVYLDNQSTTPCDERVVSAMLPWFTERFGNPHSSEHALGREASGAVEAARAEVADLIGGEAREVILVSGATEANNLAIKGAARFAAQQGDPRRRVITVATEHPCVLEATRDLGREDFEPVVLPVEPDGRLDPARLREALAVPTLLVSVMAANNETGVLQDIGALAAAAHEAGSLFHTDAAQAVGKIPLDVRDLGLDLLSLSGHKLYGPKGVGALWVRRRPRVRLAPLFSGGGQERGLRSGTLPTPLVVGLGEACRLARAEMAEEARRVGALRERLLAGLRRGVAGLRVNGSMAHRLAGNLNLVFPGADAQALIAAVPDLCVSTGSACSSAEVETSHVLRAIGVPDSDARCSLRLGLGRFTSAADVDFAVASLAAAYRAETSYAQDDLRRA